MDAVGCVAVLTANNVRRRDFISTMIYERN